MTSLTDIEKKALSTFSYGERLYPTRDWLILLLIALVLFIASIGVNVWIYEGVKNANTANNGMSVAPHVDASPIDSAEAVFKARAAEQARYESGYQFVDPSK